MGRLIFISHPDVHIDPLVPVTQWGLNETGSSRAQRFASSAVVEGVSAIWTSAETKAQDTALIIAKQLGVPVQTDPQLGENDRSSTGFMPRADFEAAADAFFAQPQTSFRGWERACDAQSRIKGAVKDAIRTHDAGDLAVVSHGAVGTLLYCALMGLPINRSHDQPDQGHYWSAELSDLKPLHPWRRLD